MLWLGSDGTRRIPASASTPWVNWNLTPGDSTTCTGMPASGVSMPPRATTRVLDLATAREEPWRVRTVWSEEAISRAAPPKPEQHTAAIASQGFATLGWAFDRLEASAPDLRRSPSLTDEHHHNEKVMGRSTINEVRAVRDSVDRLEWTLELATDFFGTRPNDAYVLDWVGRAVFYREPVAPNSKPGPQHPRMTLDANCRNWGRARQLRMPNPTSLVLVSEITSDALEKIERFRDSGRMYVRIEGCLTVVVNESENDGHPWLTDLQRLFGDRRRVPHVDVWSASFELTRDLWCDEILSTLQPPGRYVVEVLPHGVTEREAAGHIMRHVSEAREALTDGRFEEVGRICYRALDELSRLGDAVRERYGKLGRERLADQIQSTKSLCNPSRHGNQPAHDGFSMSRALATHILAVTSSLAGVLLAP